MEAKFFNSIYGGDSENGVKLCMGLTEGDFWSRPAGVQILYAGTEFDDIDFGRIVNTSNIDTNTIEVSSGHISSRLFYLVRRANCCGEEEQTINAAIRLEFDSLGNLVEYGCNKITDVSAQQADGDKVKLIWFYQTIHQTKKIKGFYVYSDNATGTIDYDNPAATIDYVGRKFYEFTTGSLVGSCYKFCIRAVAEDDSISQFTGKIKIGMDSQCPDGVELLICQIL